MIPLNNLVKLAFVAWVAQQFALYQPRTWTCMWEWVLAYHVQIGAVGVGVAAVSLACVDFIAPLEKVCGKMVEIGERTGTSVVSGLVRVVLAICMFLVACVWGMIAFGPKDKSDMVWTAMASLFGSTWARFVN